MSVSGFGRIGRDAELKYTQQGTAVCETAIAVDYGMKGQDGKKPTQWYSVTLWGKQAEALAQYLVKGKQVYFTGSDLHVETFQKNDGTQGVKLVCRAGEIKFASDGSQSQSPQQQPAQQQQRPAQQPQRPAAPQNQFDESEDIPW